MRLFEREDYLEKIRGFYHDDGVTKVLTGVRRCGKSRLMQTDEGTPDALDTPIYVFFQS